MLLLKTTQQLIKPTIVRIFVFKVTPQRFIIFNLTLLRDIVEGPKSAEP